MFAKTLCSVLAISLLQVLTAQSAQAQAGLAKETRAYEKLDTVNRGNEAAAPTGTTKEAKFAAKVKAAIAILGTGPSARINPAWVNSIC